MLAELYPTVRRCHFVFFSDVADEVGKAVIPACWSLVVLINHSGRGITNLTGLFF